jgi:hypothetical protein
MNAATNNANVVTHDATPLVLTQPLANVQVITLTNTATLQLPAMNGQTPSWKGRYVLVCNNATGATTNATEFNVLAQDGSTVIYPILLFGQSVLLHCTDDSTANGTWTTAALFNGRYRTTSSSGTAIDITYNNSVLRATGTDAAFTAPTIGTADMVYGFNFWLVNTSTTNTTFTPTASNLINGKAYLSLAPTEAAFIFCTGSTWITPSLSRTADTVLKEITATSATMAQNNGYIANNAALVTLTLPVVAQAGSIIEVIGQGAGGWKIAQNSGQQINYDASQTTLGVGGSLASTVRYNCVKLRCVLDDLLWTVVNSQGNLTTV